MWDNNRISVWANSGNGIVAYPYVMDDSGLGAGVSVGTVIGHEVVRGLSCGGGMVVVCVLLSVIIVVVVWVGCVVGM